MTTVEAPLEFVEALAGLRFPQKTDALLQDLMDRNTDGRLNEPERNELDALVELSERLTILRAQARTARRPANDAAERASPPATKGRHAR
jgi:hypothetical protein